jgi:quercetin dioxygenase-like cupin family protein
MMKNIRGSCETMACTLLCLATLGVPVLFAVAASSAQAPQHGVVRPLTDVKLAEDGKPECLVDALENGDPDTGPSTFIMKATEGCVVPAHYHTAEEQLIVVRGEVLTGMEGMSEGTLGPGGFAMMPGKAVHWFTCKSKDGCLMFVTFDRKYDIVWVKDKK